MYCVKCKKKYEPEKPKETTFMNRGNKMRALTSTCPTCGTKGYEILGKAQSR